MPGTTSPRTPWNNPDKASCHHADMVKIDQADNHHSVDSWPPPCFVWRCATSWLRRKGSMNTETPTRSKRSPYTTVGTTTLSFQPSHLVDADNPPPAVTSCHIMSHHVTLGSRDLLWRRLWLHKLSQTPKQPRRHSITVRTRNQFIPCFCAPVCPASVSLSSSSKFLTSDCSHSSGNWDEREKL